MTAPHPVAPLPLDTPAGHVANALQALELYRSALTLDRSHPGWDLIDLLDSARLRLTLALDLLRHQEVSQ